ADVTTFPFGVIEARHDIVVALPARCASRGGGSGRRSRTRRSRILARRARRVRSGRDPGGGYPPDTIDGDRRWHAPGAAEARLPPRSQPVHQGRDHRLRPGQRLAGRDQRGRQPQLRRGRAAARGRRPGRKRARCLLRQRADPPISGPWHLPGRDGACDGDGRALRRHDSGDEQQRQLQRCLVGRTLVHPDRRL
ncbi:MAG: hypothetical protein AVDCRST_MAG87-1713, partial [uncultured Thermomicrobiales bacterium]